MGPCFFCFICLCNFSFSFNFHQSYGDVWTLSARIRNQDRSYPHNRSAPQSVFSHGPGPVDIGCQNDIESTSMRRHHVASTLIRRHFGTECSQGSRRIDVDTTSFWHQIPTWGSHLSTTLNLRLKFHAKKIYSYLNLHHPRDPETTFVKL